MAMPLLLRSRRQCRHRAHPPHPSLGGVLPSASSCPWPSGSPGCERGARGGRRPSPRPRRSAPRPHGLRRGGGTSGLPEERVCPLPYQDFDLKTQKRLQTLPDFGGVEGSGLKSPPHPQQTIFQHLKSKPCQPYQKRAVPPPRAPPRRPDPLTRIPTPARRNPDHTCIHANMREVRGTADLRQGPRGSPLPPQFSTNPATRNL